MDTQNAEKLMLGYLQKVHSRFAPQRFAMHYQQLKFGEANLPIREGLTIPKGTTMQKSISVITSPEVLFQELDNETVLLNLATEQYHGLDETGTRIWQLLTQHGGVEPVVTQMLAEYDVSEAQLRQDVAHLIEELAEAGLVNVETA